jgi:hypothetical protein
MSVEHIFKPHITMNFGKSEWIQAAEKTAGFFGAMLDRDASAFPLTLIGLDKIKNLREKMISLKIL